MSIKHWTVIFSKGKPDWTYTHGWFRRFGCRPHKLGVKLIVSDDDDVDQYERVWGCEALVAHGTKTLAAKRQWAVENLLSDKVPWLVWFEDNILKVTAVSESHYGLSEIWPTRRDLYHSRELSPRELMPIIGDDLALADRLGVRYGGFACNDNHYYRSLKYRTGGFVWAKMGYCHKDGPAWPAEFKEMDDYAHSAENLLKVGKVLINNFVYPWAQRGEGRGGSRKLEDRWGDKAHTVRKLMERYPDLFVLANPTGDCPLGTEVLMNKTEPEEIRRWRAVMNRIVLDPNRPVRPPLNNFFRSPSPSSSQT